MKYLKSRNPVKHLLNTISYFSFFGYPPTFDEIHTFFPVKIAKKGLKTLLERLILEKKVIQLSFRAPIHRDEKSREVLPTSRFLSRSNKTKKLIQNDKLDRQNSLFSTFYLPSFSSFRYTLPQYPYKFDLPLQRKKTTLKKLTSIKCLIKVFRQWPFFRFVGVTGSAAMANCRTGDDVDLFIITARKTLFIGRFLAIVLSYIYYVRRGKNRVCLNLFFDESNVVVPLQKQTQYVAHEVLQMKPVVNKGQTYERFLEANKWIYDYFPNASVIPPPDRRRGQVQEGMIRFLLQPLEIFLKHLQLLIIRKNNTGLIITNTQLWLFRKDFEKKIKRYTSTPNTSREKTLSPGSSFLLEA